MHGWGLFFLLFFVFLIFAIVGRVIFIHLRARRLDLPSPTFRSYIPFINRDGSGTAVNYPTPRSSGPLEWIKDQIGKLRNKRTARGAYEETGRGAGSGYGGGARRGRGLEDDAWDTRVGNEEHYGAGPGGYNEEQELGLAITPGLPTEPYRGGSDYLGGSTRGGGASYAHERGRSKSGERQSGSQQLGENPFGDQHEAASLRSVSPRPDMDPRVVAASQGKGKAENSDSQLGPNTSPVSRKSMFREGL